MQALGSRPTIKSTVLLEKIAKENYFNKYGKQENIGVTSLWITSSSTYLLHRGWRG